MADIITSLRNQYTLQQRKRLTFEKILACRTLSYSQIDRLKTAEALYECVPLTIYSPFVIYYLRKTAQAVTGPLIVKLCIQLLIVAPSVEICAQYTKTALYWPLIR